MTLRRPLVRFWILIPVAVLGAVSTYFAYAADLGHIATTALAVTAMAIAWVVLQSTPRGRSWLSFRVDRRLMAVAIVVLASAVVSSMVCDGMSTFACQIVWLIETAATGVAIIYFMIFWRDG